MQLRSGIPTLTEAEALFGDDLYRRMLSFDRAFVANYGRLIRRSVFRWAGQPMAQWSRRWEYPYAAQRLAELAELAEAAGGRDLTILDAGSGATFFPHYLCEQMPAAHIICCDGDQ